MSSWLNTRSFPVIHIRRHIADIAYSMLQHSWLYPAKLYPTAKNRELALVKGLTMAAKSLEAIPAVRLDFDDCIFDESFVIRAIQAIDPKAKPARLNYLTDEFIEQRRQILVRRKTPAYERLQRLADRVVESASLYSRD